MLNIYTYIDLIILTELSLLVDVLEPVLYEIPNGMVLDKRHLWCFYHQHSHADLMKWRKKKHPERLSQYHASQCVLVFSLSTVCPFRHMICKCVTTNVFKTIDPSGFTIPNSVIICSSCNLVLFICAESELTPIKGYRYLEKSFSAVLKNIILDRFILVAPWPSGVFQPAEKSCHLSVSAGGCVVLQRMMPQSAFWSHVSKWHVWVLTAHC